MQYDMHNFWQKLSVQNKSFSGGRRPIIALAPLANVTDAAFRRIIAAYGKPDVMFTEFVSADGLMHGLHRIEAAGSHALLCDLMYTESERPIVAQFFTADPDAMFRAATLARELGFDGVDINMGCPDRSVEKQGAGAALIKDPPRARAVLAAAQEGVGSLPVSIKTRTGYNKDVTEAWIGALLRGKPAAITLHARTRKEMSAVPANWGAVKRAVDIAKGSGVLIIGNGDVQDLEEAKEKAAQTGADGIMLGRAIFGNPWLFKPLSAKSPELAKGLMREEKLNVMVEHTALFEKLLGRVKNFALMKKHYKAYINSFDGAKELRLKLMDEAETASDVERIVREWQNRMRV